LVGPSTKKKRRKTKKDEMAKKNRSSPGESAVETSVPLTRAAPWRRIGGVAAAARRKNVGAAARRSSPGKRWKNCAGVVKSSSEEGAKREREEEERGKWPPRCLPRGIYSLLPRAVGLQVANVGHVPGFIAP
jgi:hypothetical protein